MGAGSNDIIFDDLWVA